MEEEPESAEEEASEPSIPIQLKEEDSVENNEAATQAPATDEPETPIGAASPEQPVESG